MNTFLPTTDKVTAALFTVSTDGASRVQRVVGSNMVDTVTEGEGRGYFTEVAGELSGEKKSCNTMIYGGSIALYDDYETTNNNNDNILGFWEKGQFYPATMEDDVSSVTASTTSCPTANSVTDFDDDFADNEQSDIDALIMDLFDDEEEGTDSSSEKDINDLCEALSNFHVSGAGRKFASTNVDLFGNDDHEVALDSLVGSITFDLPSILDDQDISSFGGSLVAAAVTEEFALFAHAGSLEAAAVTEEFALFDHDHAHSLRAFSVATVVEQEVVVVYGEAVNAHIVNEVAVVPIFEQPGVVVVRNEDAHSPGASSVATVVEQEVVVYGEAVNEHIVNNEVAVVPIFEQQGVVVVRTEDAQSPGASSVATVVEQEVVVVYGEAVNEHIVNEVAVVPIFEQPGVVVVRNEDAQSPGASSVATVVEQEVVVVYGEAVNEHIVNEVAVVPIFEQPGVVVVRTEDAQSPGASSVATVVEQEVVVVYGEAVNEHIVNEVAVVPIFEQHGVVVVPGEDGSKGSSVTKDDEQILNEDAHSLRAFSVAATVVEQEVVVVCGEAVNEHIVNEVAAVVPIFEQHGVVVVPGEDGSKGSSVTKDDEQILNEDAHSLRAFSVAATVVEQEVVVVCGEAVNEHIVNEVAAVVPIFEQHGVVVVPGEDGSKGSSVTKDDEQILNEDAQSFRASSAMTLELAFVDHVNNVDGFIGPIYEELVTGTTAFLSREFIKSNDPSDPNKHVPRDDEPTTDLDKENYAWDTYIDIQYANHHIEYLKEVREGKQSWKTIPLYIPDRLFRWHTKPKSECYIPFIPFTYTEKKEDVWETKVQFASWRHNEVVIIPKRQAEDKNRYRVNDPRFDNAAFNRQKCLKVKCTKDGYPIADYSSAQFLNHNQRMAYAREIRKQPIQKESPKPAPPPPKIKHSFLRRTDAASATSKHVQRMLLAKSTPSRTKQ